jgi:sugar phosphate isomerase/epimerase
MTGADLVSRLGVFARTFRRDNPTEVADAVIGAGYAPAARLISLVPLMGAGVVTLCTGTRDPDNMWRAHSGNTDSSAWSDLRRSLDPLLEAAREAGIWLGVEPELANVVRDARTARRLLDEVGLDASIGIILDPANLLAPDTVDRQD